MTFSDNQSEEERMSEKKYIVKLTAEERETLMGVIKAERMSKQKRTRAHVLLMIDEGEFGPRGTDAQAVEAYHCGVNLPAQLRQQLVLQGFEATLERKPQAKPSRERVLDEDGEREVIAIAQSEPPAGRARWTLELIGRRLVKLSVVDSISHETVRTILKKKKSSRTARSRG